MGTSVEIYVKYAGEGQVLAHRVAGLLEVTGYFFSDSGYVLSIDLERWIGEPGWAHLDIGSMAPGEAAGTAFAPYEFECALSMRGPVESLGRMVFERMTELGLPLAYGGEGLVFADILPGRGIREFPADTDVEEPGRRWWFEPALHTDPAKPWRPEPAPPTAPPGRAVVFETAGLLQMVPVLQEAGQRRWVTPVASIRVEAGARDVGLMLGSVLGTTAPPGRADQPAIVSDLTASPGKSTVDFGSRSVSVQIRSDGAEVVAFPRGPHPGGPEEALAGPVVDDLIRRVGADVEPAALGELVLGLVTELRSRVPA